MIAVVTPTIFFSCFLPLAAIMIAAMIYDARNRPKQMTSLHECAVETLVGLGFTKKDAIARVRLAARQYPHADFDQLLNRALRVDESDDY
jgi:Holliday junction resolvasome RuvABC DNA-binding subunit